MFLLCQTAGDFTHLGKIPCSYTHFLKNFLFPFLEWIRISKFCALAVVVVVFWFGSAQ